MMDCKKCHAFFSLFFDLSLGEPEKSEVEKHLRECASCRNEFEELTKTCQMVGQVHPVEVPEDFCERVMLRLHKEHSQARGQRFWHPLLWPSMAAAVLLVFVVSKKNLLPDEFRFVGHEGNQTASVPVVPPSNASENVSFTMRQKPELNPVLSRSKNAVVFSPVKNSSTLASAGFARSSSFGIETVALPRGGRREKETGRGLDFSSEAYDWSTADGGTARAQERILRNSPELDELLKEIGWKGDPVPALNWDRQMLIAVFLGERSSYGYSVHLQEMHARSGRLWIQYRIVPPAAGRTGGRSSRPFAFFVVPATEFPVVFAPYEQPPAEP